MPFVIYFPRGDIAMAMLDKSGKTTRCEHKGEASYYSIANKSSVTENAAWSYEEPAAEVAQIKGHLAFVLSDSVKVEQV